MVVGARSAMEQRNPSSSPPRSPLRKRVLPLPASSEDPGLSACHRCNLKTSALQLLPREWRVLLLRHECLSALFSGQICSYCFKELSVEADLYLNCLLCFSRVHYDCVPNHRLVICQSQIDDFNKFTFFDCRLFPKLIAKLLLLMAVLTPAARLATVLILISPMLALVKLRGDGGDEDGLSEFAVEHDHHLCYAKETVEMLFLGEFGEMERLRLLATRVAL